MPQTNTAQTFALHKLPGRALCWLGASMAFLLAQATLIFWLVPRQPVAHAIVAIGTAATLLLLLIFILLRTDRAVRIEEGRLVLRLPLYGRTIPLADIVPGSARAIAPDTDPDWRITLRTNGLAVPGYRLGWFRTAGAGRTLVAQTGPTALAFRTTSGFAVILSVTDPAGLARALGEHAS